MDWISQVDYKLNSETSDHKIILMADQARAGKEIHAVELKGFQIRFFIFYFFASV